MTPRSKVLEKDYLCYSSKAMKVIVCLIALFVVCAHSYGHYPLDAEFYQPGVNVFVDCTSGSDSTGNGAANNPYQTIAYAMSATPITNNLITIVVSNGPCGEPAINPTSGYFFTGSNPTTHVKLTNGVSYTSSGTDWLDIIFSNFELPTISIDMTGANTAIYMPRFYNCKISDGSVVGATSGFLSLAAFYNSQVSLSQLTGFANFYDCHFVACTNIGAGSSIMTKGGDLDINPVMGDMSSFRMNGGDNSGAAFQCAGTGLNQPVLYYGASGSAPSQTGCALVQEDDTYDLYTDHGSATFTGAGTIAISVTEIFGYFDILITPTSDFGGASFWIPETSITSTGFVVHGPAGGTFRWRIVKG
jgi:hypothetical protein